MNRVVGEQCRLRKTPTSRTTLTIFLPFFITFVRAIRQSSQGNVGVIDLVRNIKSIVSGHTLNATFVGTFVKGRPAGYSVSESWVGPSGHKKNPKGCKNKFHHSLALTISFLARMSIKRVKIYDPPPGKLEDSPSSIGTVCMHGHVERRVAREIS